MNFKALSRCAFEHQCKGKLNINNEQKVALAKNVESWLREQGLISGNELVEMRLRVLPATQAVVIVDDTGTGEKTIKEVLQHMPRNVRVRMGNSLNNANIASLEKLTSLSVNEMLKWRNTGKRTIIPLGEALKQSGLSDCLLVQDIDRYFARDKQTLKAQSDRSVIKPLEDSDWESLLASIQRVERRHTAVQEKIVTALRKARNEPTNASELFSKITDPLSWASFIHLINLRWESSKLPYRMKLTPTPTPKCKQEGRVQIGFYQEQG